MSERPLPDRAFAELALDLFGLARGQARILEGLELAHVRSEGDLQRVIAGSMGQTRKDAESLAAAKSLLAIMADYEAEIRALVGRLEAERAAAARDAAEISADLQKAQTVRIGILSRVATLVRAGKKITFADLGSELMQ